MSSSTSAEKPLDPPKADIEKATPTSAETIPDDSDDDFLTGQKLSLVILAAALAMFLVALDRTIIATAIPRITDTFHSLKDVGWYASAYLITSCATQLTWGRFYTFYSSKAVFLSAIFLFELGSVVCGAAPSSNAFIVGRALAGMGSAGIYSGTVILIAAVVPLGKRPAFVGMMGSIFGVSSIVAPVLGGAFTDRVSWRWCFYINLPIGAVTVVILVLILHLKAVEPVSWKQQILQLDPFGTIVLLPGIVCFLLALQWGGSTYPWNDGHIIALFTLAGFLFSTFVGIQLWQQENATVPPRIYKQRSIFCSAAYAMCVGGSMITMIYFVPLWFQAVKGVSAVQSGINCLPLVFSLVIAAIFSGVFISKTGWYNPWIFACSTLMAIGAGLITTFQPDTGSSKWIGFQVIFGLGLGMGMQQAGTAVQAVLAQKDVSVGVSLMFFSQSLGGAIFICIGQAVFQNALAETLSTISDIDPLLVIMAGATELWNVIAAQDLPAVLVAYNEALTKAFIVALAAASSSIIPALGIKWKNVKGLKHGGPSPAIKTLETKKAAVATAKQG